jgi:hypothetical protein
MELRGVVAQKKFGNHCCSPNHVLLCCFCVSGSACLLLLLLTLLILTLSFNTCPFYIFFLLRVLSCRVCTYVCLVLPLYIYTLVFVCPLHLPTYLSYERNISFPCFRPVMVRWSVFVLMCRLVGWILFSCFCLQFYDLFIFVSVFCFLSSAHIWNLSFTRWFLCSYSL